MLAAETVLAQRPDRIRFALTGDSIITRKLSVYQEPEYLARLINYFREYPCDRRPDDDFKGETFWYVVRHYGLSVRERFILNYLYGYPVGEEIPFRKINHKWKNEKKNNTLLEYNDIDTLIRKFKMAGIQIAELHKDEDLELIITNLAEETDLMKTKYFEDDLGGL